MEPYVFGVRNEGNRSKVAWTHTRDTMRHFFSCMLLIGWVIGAVGRCSIVDWVSIGMVK